jgi:hypothetical protein
MSDEQIESRLAAIEAALAEILRRLEEPASRVQPGWLKRFTGSMRDMPGFEEMVKYGREFRESDRPADSEE